MKRVVYTTAKGDMQIREVPNDATPDDYHKGIMVGPPDLSSLDLSKTKRRQLNDLLVKKGFAELPDTKGKRSELLSTVRSVVGNDRAREVFREVLSIYVQDYYPDNFS